MLIALSGMDGSGKTTLAKALLTGLKERGVEAADLAMGPSRAWTWAETLRRQSGDRLEFNADALSLALNFERFSFVSDHVAPSLRYNVAAVVQRYVIDWLAVGRAFGAGDSETSLMSAFIDHICVPTVSIYLDVTPEVALQRIGDRGGPDGVRESAEMLIRMSAAYEEVLHEFPPTVRLDATLPTTEQVRHILENVTLA